MPDTPIYHLPYPLLTDGADVPTDLGHLAQAIEIALMTGGGSPPGAVLAYHGPTVPTGFLACDGAEYLIADYPALYAVVTDKYGAASADHFRVPDTRSRSIVGAGAGYAVGSTGGSENVTLTEAQLPAHAHSGTTDGCSTSQNHNHGGATTTGAFIKNVREIAAWNLLGGGWGMWQDSGGNYGHRGSHGHTCGTTDTNHLHSYTTSSAGSGGAHSNLAPVFAVTHIIKT